MRRILILLLFCLIFFSLFTESVFWEEDFGYDMVGWEIGENWIVAASYLVLCWTPIIEDYDISTYSPPIILPQNVGDLKIDQFLEGGTATDELAEINIIINGVSHTIWNWEIALGDWGEPGGDVLTLPLSEFAGELVKFQFRTFGSTSSALSYWYLYDMVITELDDNDLKAVRVYGPEIAELGTQDIWKIIVKNNGMLPADSYVVKLYNEGQELGSIIVNEPLEPLEITDHIFYWTPTIEEDTQLNGEVIFIDDEDNANNLTDSFNLHIYPEGEQQYLVWDNDNHSYYYDPVNGQMRGSQYGIQQALIANGINFETVSQLPEVLYNYEVVFTCLGLYCVG